jgi:L-ascorbate metabolism protein UlaG (beta-lactamase superfamily)
MTFLKRAEKQGSKFLNPIVTGVGGPDMMLKIIPLYLTNKEKRVPKIPLGPFDTDPAIYRTPPPSGLRVTWMGHSSTLVEIDGFRVLIDPVWDERASPFRFMGPKRFFSPPLRLEDLPRIDVVLISHDHYDHLGKMTTQRLAKLDAISEARWITSLGVGASLRSFGAAPERITELDWTEAITIPHSENESLKITALPARHFSGRGLSNRFETLWSSFALKGPQHNVYFGGDSGLWPGFAEIGEKYGPFDLTMLEIGASNPLWSNIHMGPDGAAQAFAELGASGLLMPIHWGLFDLALHAWHQPIERMTELADAAGFPLFSPEPGVPADVAPGRELRSSWWRRVADPALLDTRNRVTGVPLASD